MTGHSSSYRLRRAADTLLGGGVVCHATEAVWGLAALPGDAAAVARILRLKSRDPAKGLILVADCAQRFAPLIQPLEEPLRQRLLAAWPGAVSWVVPDEHWAPVWVRGQHGSVAIRVSAHPQVAALCASVGSCLVSTSANPAGLAAARCQRDAQRYFGARVDYYLPGATLGRAKPSEIRGLISGEVLRD